VLGICRGCQLINVAFGGTLYQDIGTQIPGALDHRDIAKYERNFHALKFVPGTQLAKLYPSRVDAVINTIHHQAVNKLGRGMIVEALAEPDGIVEAIRWRDYPIVQNLVMLIAVVVVSANFIVDMLYAMLDPRIRHGHA